MSSIPEKRIHKRMSTVVNAKFMPDTDLIFDWDCETMDLSEGGMRLVSIREPLVGNYSEVGFYLPNHGDRLAVQSEVVWTRPVAGRVGYFEIGIKFSELSEHKRKILKDYLMQNKYL